MDNKSVVVMGGGITGLTSAYVLCKKGFKVTVIEKNDYAGGLAATFAYKNYLLDYGPHNFHTHNEGVMRFVRDELKVPLKKMKVTSSKLFFMGKFVNYPLKIGDAIKNLDLSLSARCFIDYIGSRIALKFKRKKEDRSFEEWLENRFGKLIYDLYFGPYVNKVWGLPGSELDAVIARKRIPEPSLFSMIVRALSGFRHGKKHSEDPESVESYYPPRGIGAISDALKERIVALGGTVDLGCSPTSVVSEGKTRYCEYAHKGAKKRLEWDYLVNTIPISEFFPILKVTGSEKISKDIPALPYRSIILLYMFLSVEKVFDVPWIYFNEKDNPDLIFNRMYEIGNFSQDMIHGGKGAICLEITCYKGDELWKKTDKQLFEICMNYLEKNKFMRKNDVVEMMTKRLDIAYPVFRKGYHAHLWRVIEFLAKDAGVFCAGRQGLFSYANIDHCIDMGLKLDRLFNPLPDTDKFKSLYANYLS